MVAISTRVKYRSLESSFHFEILRVTTWLAKTETIIKISTWLGGSVVHHLSQSSKYRLDISDTYSKKDRRLLAEIQSHNLISLQCACAQMTKACLDNYRFETTLWRALIKDCRLFVLANISHNEIYR